MNYEITNNIRWKFTPSLIEAFSLIFGVTLVLWYAWVMDDAYVYFRYVDNWIIHGKGLVWNQGEYVEGFSSPIWTLYLGILRFFQFDYWLIIRLTAVLSFTAFWYLSCLVNRGFIKTSSNVKVLNIPLVYLSFTYAVSSYFSSGLESPFVIVSAAVYAAGIIWPHSKVFQFLIGLTPLIRHELIIPFVLFLFWSYFLKRIKPVYALLSFAVSFGSYELFRIWYYADLFPNTFYLKDEISILQGFSYLYDSLMPYFTIPYLLFMGIIYLAIRQLNKHQLSNERLAMIIFSLPILLYVIKIGGDPRHFRYLAFPFVLIILSTSGLAEHFFSTFTNLNKNYIYSGIIIFALSIFMCFPRQLQQHPLLRDAFSYRHTTFLKINDAAVHRLSPTRITPQWFSTNSILSYNEAKKRLEIDSRKDATDFYNLDIKWIKPTTCPKDNNPIIAVDWCQTAYLNASSSAIHSLGLTEPFLARTNMLSDRPGHKLGLMPLAKDILKLRCEYGFSKGVFNAALKEGKLPKWMRTNIETLNAIEEKVYNDHNLLENLRIALSKIKRIQP